MAPTITDNCEFECATVEATTTSATTIGESDYFDSSAIGGSSDNFEESNELHLNGQQDQDVQEEQQQQQQMPWEAPGKQGLYDPQNEHEACGVGFIVAIDGKRSHKILRDAQTLSERMNHRGACACDNDTGDGAGVLASIPHGLYFKALAKQGQTLPELGDYATGIFYLDEAQHAAAEKEFDDLAKSLGLEVIAWRTVPANQSAIGVVARKSEPLSRQVFVRRPAGSDEKAFERQVFVLRKRASHELIKPGRRFYICSLSDRTVVYKGLFTSDQLWDYYTDLKDPEFETYLALVHTRFSTNTFPSWERAHPLRVLAHNGEINTLRGNVNLMKAREGVMQSELFGDQLKKLYPVVEPNLSDSGSFDCVLEFLTMASDRSLPESVMTMVPEAWQNDKTMPQEKRDFYQWAACVMEPWDGPALISFTDGRYIGAVLDRNGLRPSRFYVTKENVLVMASEVGVYDVDPSQVTLKSRLKPGRMLLVDTKEKKLIQDIELKSKIAKSRPHSEWLQQKMITLDEIRNANVLNTPPVDELAKLPASQRGIFDPRLSLFGYTTETVNMLLIPMFKNKKEALGSMGNDAPLACLSNFQPIPYEYFKQLFAQVTNPPIDPFREKVVMSMQCPLGPEANLLQPSAQQVHRIWLTNPILSIPDTQLLKRNTHRGWRTKVLDITFQYNEGVQGYIDAIDRVCREGYAAAQAGYQLLVVSDRGAGIDGKVAVSALLALGALHHHLIETLQRMKVGIVVETAEAREVHHICVLLGYGADAICPYLAFELAQALRDDGVIGPEVNDKQIYAAYAQAIDTGIAKVMAKMGISTLQSYKSAQIFEAVGLGSDLVTKCFRGTQSRIGGVTLEILAKEGLQRYQLTYGKATPDTRILRNPGQYHWRHGGEAHINEPSSIGSLQEAAVNKNLDAFEAFKKTTLDSVKKCALRGQLEFVTDRQSIDISEVEPASEIVKRFATGAMSFGSISLEAHQTLSITMNRIGGKSNTGEGGEDSDRYLNQDPNHSRRSAIKQVASGRFGVTASYLANADDLQIKMAQGAKPGEGGELPGYKVTKDIAKTRKSVPGVGLISPPPHHDIYSIEDLAELIYDLKCSNPNARISVKLVSEVGVGVVASGVAKGKAEHIVISGHDGGTGASSWTGIKNAGLPWELGVAETHQVLVLNNLRSRVIVQADGQLRTGFDVVVAALLGADEFGFSTAPLIVMGCTMMRKCHLNTCPVGIATQDPELRKKFTGKPEHVINFFFMLAEDIRKIMAGLGIRKFQDLIGRTDLLRVASQRDAKASNLDLKLLLQPALELRPGTNIVGGSVKQDFQLEKRSDNELIAKAQQIFSGADDNVTVKMRIHNEERAFGSTLSYHIACKYGEAGLPAGKSIDIFLEGSAGQSFCAFLARGVNVTLKGDANDYVGKGLCGGNVVITPQDTVPFESHLNVIVGNVCLYGATEGTAYFRGIASERFCVRNSGVTAVVEGVGDHGCEYMTGGVVVILGLTGRNFAAGMSGGIAYVYDLDGSFKPKVNPESVELLPLESEKDVLLVKELLTDFIEKTGSKVAKELLDNWAEAQGKFVKVFPYEYQKALKDMAEQQAVEQPLKSAIENGNGKHEPHIKDIEESIQDVVLEQKRADRVLDKTRGFVKYKRESAPYRDAGERQKDWNEVYNFPHVRKNLKVQAARCMECGVPFCQSNSTGCPLGNIIPKWNDLVFHGEWQEALRQLLQTNNFPEFTGRVCPAPCEGSCVLGISEPAVTIKNIECAIIDHAFEQGWIKPEIPEVRTGKRVAIVGSGPSGLAASQQLNRAGHFVTVFERNDRVGGLLQYGIPTMKLSKEVVKRRVDLMADEGIEFRTNVHVGKDLKAEQLLQEYDAVLLTTGSTWPRDLPLANRDLKGIHFAMEFLEAQQKKQLGGKNDIISAAGKNVIIIGGGDTGCDCIATSLRQGAKSITTFEILPEPPQKRAEDNPWPQWPKVFRVDYGHEEVKLKWGKDPRQYCTTTKEFVGENGAIKGVNTVEVEWTKTETGQWRMQEVAGSEKYFPADLILLAMGFLGPEKTVPSELGLELDPRGNIKASNGQYGTSNSKVFAAGDCRRGQSLVVWAITEGRQAARQVDSYLTGRPSGLPGPGGVIGTS
ncbi:glutamate synthase [NADH], amyloplastic isoform X1 [Drosophila teissieri]|uniref:glutamate synthase [NADH], amyloplastic isoform X1 n=1 Tax=Drosophila teissieri TaxID=7243 RepID=UPI001CBA5D17|nr:glutamate synthase [NADH], amyloplastic isoform X1 [Drosophila teissieri]XP_043646380.1 glutamate synthase [NADH], amyloplastic isoform X1 [Drosophila teissieri]